MPGPVNPAGSAHPAGAADPADAGGLHAFYSRPDATFSSGPDRARRQARMLAGVLARRPGPLRIVDVGCGDGRFLRVVVDEDLADAGR